MNRQRRPSPPITATLLYALGLLALFTVALSLGGGETGMAHWGLIAIPVTLIATASLTMRRARVDRARPADGYCRHGRRSDSGG
jgi:hypothetical protein